MARRKIIITLSDKELKEIVDTSISKRHVEDKLKERGALYGRDFVNAFIKRLKLDTSHFTGRWKIPNQDKRYPIETRLVKGKFRGNSALKHRLIKLNILDAKCSSCGLREWQGQPAPLEIDHINGDPYDNRLKNLRILCPNCHAQTPTANGKNIKKKNGGSTRT